MTSKIPGPSSHKKETREDVDIKADLDVFAAALDDTRANLANAINRPGEMSRYASRPALEASWRDSLAELQVSFEKTDQSALALIRLIKVMLALE